MGTPPYEARVYVIIAPIVQNLHFGEIQPLSQNLTAVCKQILPYKTKSSHNPVKRLWLSKIHFILVFLSLRLLRLYFAVKAALKIRARCSLRFRRRVVVIVVISASVIVSAGGAA